jgi:SAM-dependent methyltransferase
MVASKVPTFAAAIHCKLSSLAATTSSFNHKWAVFKRIAAKRLYKILGNYNQRLQPHSFFSIKPGYHHATSAEQFDDTNSTDEWQREVYELANDVLTKAGYTSVIDVGCGSGYKLVHLLNKYITTGIEIDPAFSFLQRKYPDRKWLLFEHVIPSQLKADVVICSDVIEHLDNPDDVLDFISEIDFQQLIISTPERDAVAGRNDFGPPENTSHYREWNAIEFKNYLRQWFVVKEQQIFNAKSVTQVVICVKK